jgi:hypothetical protein
VALVVLVRSQGPRKSMRAMCACGSIPMSVNARRGWMPTRDAESRTVRAECWRGKIKMKPSVIATKSRINELNNKYGCDHIRAIAGGKKSPGESFGRNVKLHKISQRESGTHPKESPGP